MNRLFVLSFVVACIPMSRGDTMAARNQQIARMCSDTGYAYETGYNDGLGRRRLDTSWAQSCAPQVQADVRRAYQGGFDRGISNAPTVIQTRAEYTASATCRFSSDCGAGQSCRADASGTQVWMGGGYAGDACWFSSDCVSDSCDGAAKVCR